MTAVFVPDVSEYQVPVDDSYNRDWFIFRACFGAYTIDPHAAHNLAWAKQAKASGKIKGFTVYVVYLPGANAGILGNLNELGVPDDCVVMIDVETWRGQSYEIKGDHSKEINALAASLRERQGGNAGRVWDYGNQGDLAEVHPTRPDWLGVIVAGYGFKLSPTTVPNQIGQQYTNGQPVNDIDGWPSATPPFGRCDHNVIYTLPETDLSFTDADLHDIAVAVKQAVIDAAGDTIASTLRDLADAADALAKSVAAVKLELDTVKASVANVNTGVSQLVAGQTSTGGVLHVSGDLTVS